MNEAELTELKSDWLSSGAVVAFLGALLVGQAWAAAMDDLEDTVELLYIITVPNYTGLVLVAFILGLLGLALFLGLASMVPSLQDRGVRIFRPVAPALTPIVLVTFILSWLSSLSELPRDQPWSQALVAGGIAMFALVGLRPVTNFLITVLRRDVRKSNVSDQMPASNPDTAGITKMLKAIRPVKLFSLLNELYVHIRRIGSRGFWIVGALIVAAVQIALAVLFWDWLKGSDSGSATVRNVGLMIAASLAFVLAIWRALVADRQSTTAQQSLLNERYQKGVEMLGSEVLSVRVGGIYSIRHLARERPDLYHLHMMRLLCAFARNPPLGQPGQTELVTTRESLGTQFSVLREDLQAVINVIRARSEDDVDIEFAGGYRLELQHADLRGAILSGADLRNAFFWGADLSGAILTGTRLDSARLTDAVLSNSQFGDDERPASGLTQRQLDEASADPGADPYLTGVVDADTGKALVWKQGPNADDG